MSQEAVKKRLVVFSDGTWKSENDDRPSNVHRMHGLVSDHGDDGVKQEKRYQPGVGTDPGRGRIRRRLSQWGGGAFGWGLDRNIRELYGWLVENYEPGDELWFFGFSRGAYTVRSTAGLIRNCGILRREHAKRAKEAMDMYRDRSPEGHPDSRRAKEFRNLYAHEIKGIKFLGVWDTVGSLGVPSWLGRLARMMNRRHQFHDVQLSSSVQNARHALAVDERRRSFTPAIWREEKKPFAGDVVQVWMSGVHSDVGGGYDERGLSDIALHWMIQEAHGKGLGFDRKRLIEETKPRWSGRLHDSRWPPHRLPGLARIMTRRRTIDTGHAQWALSTAKERLDGDPEYAAPGLRLALDAGLPVRPWVPIDDPATRLTVRAAGESGEDPLVPTQP